MLFGDCSLDGPAYTAPLQDFDTDMEIAVPIWHDWGLLLDLFLPTYSVLFLFVCFPF